MSDIDTTAAQYESLGRNPMEQVSKREALLRIYQAVNQPMKLGRKWVTYSRDNVDAQLFVLKQLMEMEGYEFRKGDE